MYLHPAQPLPPYEVADRVRDLVIQYDIDDALSGVSHAFWCLFAETPIAGDVKQIIESCIKYGRDSLRDAVY
jgi:hypothetical protein